ncbi:unnamed protein product [Danaus chrysippus]|uniref:(African queen) hypothetical protein n=1 Tax=Danaus chrysippus TaxID=151541 RepID=A0A8J2QD07_9NEOP|nr:unnamed protein product [Danaus chrysippus]
MASSGCFDANWTGVKTDSLVGILDAIGENVESGQIRASDCKLKVIPAQLQNGFDPCSLGSPTSRFDLF